MQLVAAQEKLDNASPWTPVSITTTIIAVTLLLIGILNVFWPQRQWVRDMYASYCPAVDAGNKAEEAFEKAKNKLKAERKAILELEMEGGGHKFGNRYYWGEHTLQQTAPMPQAQMARKNHRGFLSEEG